MPTGPEADEYGWVLEATSALTWVAARFPDLRVGFSVMIPAMRDAPLAGQAARDDRRLTGGRLTVGVGSSDKHDLPEYENLGKADRFDRRGAYLDESIALWRHLWGGCTEPFEGEFHQLRDYNFQPLPPQGAELPIWCGGRSDRSSAAPPGSPTATTPRRPARRHPRRGCRSSRPQAEAAGRPP